MEDGKLHATSRNLGSIATVGTVPGDGLSLINDLRKFTCGHVIGPFPVWVGMNPRAGWLR